MRARGTVKSPVREYCTPGSVRGAPGNRRPYRDHGPALGAVAGMESTAMFAAVTAT